MADVIVDGTLSPAGGIVYLDQPGQRLRSKDGSLGIVRGAVYVTKEGAGATIDPTIKLELPGGFSAQAGAVQCAASRVGIHCEIDLGGNPMQGVQIIQWNGEIPDACDISGLYAYNNAQRPGDADKMHGIYVQDSTNLRGRNVRFSDIRGGWGIHFYCNQNVQVCRGARLEQVTCERNLGDVIFWGPGVADNRVDKLLSLGAGAKGVVTQNQSAQGHGNVVDHVTTPTSGYGYQEEVVTPPLPGGGDAEAQLQAWRDWYASAPGGPWAEWWKRAPITSS